ncbi:MAG: hypothetical protein HOA85_01345 [Candidatus Pacebacteria bacterium]|jgi:dCMP deaminase|nr:hypothetical protein [Candidatus Paceibacterota bacterium]MBT6755903.1 hypothetical protein [Candidatus Paceibacterota bacterium]
MSSKVIKNNSILVSYIPVLHQGYLNFFSKNSDIKKLWIIGTELAHELRPLQKDIRALPPETIKKLISSLEIFEKVEILTPQNIKVLQQITDTLIFSDETLSHHLTQKYFSKNTLKFDATFLMWDKNSSLKKNDLKEYKEKSNTENIQKIANKAIEKSTRSDDWWRHVGAVIFRNEEILLSGHNQHTPTEYETAYEGDPRANFHKGEYLKVSTAVHAEALLIAKAAKKGISLEGAELLVTTFPCPVCAKQIAHSGIKKVYFIEGYSVLDGERILRNYDIEIEKITIS